MGGNFACNMGFGAVTCLGQDLTFFLFLLLLGSLLRNTCELSGLFSETYDDDTLVVDGL